MYQYSLLKIRHHLTPIRYKKVLLVSGILFFTLISQAQNTNFEHQDLKAQYKLDSLRRQNIKMSLLSFLKDIPKDSMTPYTTRGFFQAAVTLEIFEKPLSDENLFIIETASYHICKRFKEVFLSQENKDLFTTKITSKKILGPYIYTFLIEENGNISETSKEQLKDVEGLITYTDLITAPVFPGCENLKEKELRNCFEQQLQGHIANNFRYPKEALGNGYQGNAIVSFTISQDGTLINVRSKAKHPEFADEAERIIKLLPKFKPGIYKELKVDTSFSIPFRFRLN
ncbi:TonB family protein [Ascidiimonas sp. W6]|uniref:energy transducer TonB n=1 Tax=Ascidiimonas meishanensis TaxID=3128903 RepID=UPI0030EB2737